MNCSKGQNREIEILKELPIPKKKILLSMEVITEERNLDSKCSSQLDLDKKVLVCESLIAPKQPFLGACKPPKNESEKALTFSSGTNLTQNSFDFGFSKVTSCNCCMENSTKVLSERLENEDPKGGERLVSKPKKRVITEEREANLGMVLGPNGKSGGNSTQDKNRKSKNCKCLKFAEKKKSSFKESGLAVPNFIVQPFNSPDLLLPRRDYSKDSRGTLGKPRYILYIKGDLQTYEGYLGLVVLRLIIIMILLILLF